MAINELPEELLARVLNHLHPLDRMRSALTCRRWAEVVSTSELMKDIRLNIAGFEISRASAALGSSRRQYRHLQLHRAELYNYNYNTQFWSKVSGNLRELELIDCRWSPRVFYRILGLCSKLESLKIGKSLDPPKLPRISIKDFEIPDGTTPEQIRESLSHLKHLQLHICVKRDILEYLLGLMTNVTSISLSKFDIDSDFLVQLPSMLKAHQRITELDFGSITLEDEEVMQLVGVAAIDLQELRLDCEALTPEGYGAISEFTKLRHLSLEGLAYDLEDDQLGEILASVTDLESFSIHSCSSLSNKGFAGLLKLKKLRSLKIGDYSIASGITSDFICDLAKISTLRELDLTGIGVDGKDFHSLACLRNLRALSVNSPSFDSECLEIICEHFGKLEELDLGDIEQLTDADGVKLCRLTELKSLSFSNASGFKDRTFERGIGSPTMKFLSMSGCSLTDVGLVSIAAHHARLRKLCLTDCENITDAGLIKLLRHQPVLEELRPLCISLRGKWLKALVKLCPRLRSIDIDEGTSVAATLRFVTRRPSVECRQGLYIRRMSIAIG